VIKSDILRVLAELHTFTSEDVATALDCPLGTAGSLLSIWAGKGYVERVKSVRTYIYGLSDAASKKAAKLPPIDPDERCLPLVRVNITERYLYHNNTPVLDTSEDEWPVISEFCIGCGDEFINLPKNGLCANCGVHRQW